MTTVAITGHRPDRLGDVLWAHGALTSILQVLEPTLLYQGMAAGADLLAATVAIEQNIPYVACRPWATHTAEGASAEDYAYALENAKEVVIVNPATRYEGPWLYHARNRYMVDHATSVVAIWDGSNGGGTAATVKYAREKKRNIYLINPKTRKISLESAED